MTNYDFFRPIRLLLFTYFSLCACTKQNETSSISPNSLPLEEMAMILSELPLAEEHLQEVFDAVASSSTNGYDEEYMMTDLLSSPGAGVGDPGSKAAIHLSSRGITVEPRADKRKYSKPIRDLLAEHLATRLSTKSSETDVQAYLDQLSASDLQIYWPYSETWDAQTAPIISFDPGNGAESNYGYVLDISENGAKVVEKVIVDENTAKIRPVWIINRNDDADFIPIQQEIPDLPRIEQFTEEEHEALYLRSFTMHQHYDSWFGGASEFIVKCGAVDGFRANTDAELKLYRPGVTDLMVVVKRNKLGVSIPLDALLISDYTPQMDQMAFMIIEDDGGELKSWKCTAVVKIKSKSTGIELEIPYRENDDLVWRGQLAYSFVSDKRIVSANFSGVTVKFERR